ncbi:MAG: RNA helicase [Bdellovibrionales bacterium GWB1_55_8]|nr:MAG: RNA helicase [Bdellovibrionales bacterium GWB1_55_8]
MKTFSSLDLLPSLQETLAEKGFVALTEIQMRALPALLEGRSIVGVAETGSGKTLAYALPVLHQLKSLENEGKPVSDLGRPRAVVVVPTRELGEQVTRVFKPFTHTTRLRVRNVLGGTGLDVARKNISAEFEVLVGTPGRLMKLLDSQFLDLSDVRILVFDEADQMLDQGFLPSALRIASACSSKPQMALFSATVSNKVQDLIKNLFSKAEVIRSEGSHQVVSGLTSKNLEVPHGKRFPLLEKLLSEKVEGGTIIFTNTREQCDKLAQEMKKSGYSSVVYRGEMDKVERRKNLQLFRDGKIPFLISTDLASRGLDVEHVGRVINYHLPQQMENYIHRVGRTARAGRKGLVINFVTERDEAFVAKLDTLRSRKASGARSAPSPDSSKEWPSEPAHKPPPPKIIPVGRPMARPGRKGAK